MFNTQDNLYPLAEVLPVMILVGIAILILATLIWLGKDDNIA